MSSSKLPAKLFKYEPFSAQALANLKAQGIYFGSPRGFNDPYDCAISPIVKRPTAAEAETIRAHYLQQPLDSDVHSGFSNASTEEFQDMLERSGRAAIDSAIEKFLKERGVSCFSEKNDDLLMWGHYGGKYKGYCLEFSTSFAPFSGAKKVEYVNRIPDTSVTPFILGEQLEKVADFFCIKPESWAYECEWRIMHQVGGTLYHYEAEALTGVYFGPEISTEALEIVCLILRGQNADVKFYRGYRSATEFKVNFQEFNYLSYLEAKKLGLR